MTRTRAKPASAPRRCSCGGIVESKTGECSACRARRLAAERSQTGKPLDPRLRSSMEARFGHDFGAVRVHADPAAAHAAGARAFTVGTDIVLGHGERADATPGGSALMAHELAHVVQQSRGGGAAPAPQRLRAGAAAIGPAGRAASGPESALEADAEAAAHAAVTGRAVTVRGRAAPGTLQRAAPAAAPAAGAAAILTPLAIRCVVSAAFGVVLDLVIQYGLHAWRNWDEATEKFKVDMCSVVFAAIVGCIGGIASLKLLEPFLARQFPALSGAGATILGRLLLWCAAQGGMLIPKTPTKFLLQWGCISVLEAEALHPGVSTEAATESAPASPPAGATP